MPVGSCSGAGTTNWSATRTRSTAASMRRGWSRRPRASEPADRHTVASEEIEMHKHLHRPVFIMSPPRAGSTLLFNVLADSRDAWTIGGESHRVIEDIPALDPRKRGFDSNRLTAHDVSADVV